MKVVLLDDNYAAQNPTCLFQLASLMEEYLKESVYKDVMTFDLTNTLSSIVAWATGGGVFIAVDDEDDSGEDFIYGFAVAEFGTTFYAEMEGDISFFYVSPLYKGDGTARKLRDAAIEYLLDKGAAVIYACALSNDEYTKPYENLFAKAGFVKKGTTMIRFTQKEKTND